MTDIYDSFSTRHDQRYTPSYLTPLQDLSGALTEALFPLRTQLSAAINSSSQCLNSQIAGLRLNKLSSQVPLYTPLRKMLVSSKVWLAGTLALYPFSALGKVSKYARWVKDNVFSGPLVEERGLNTSVCSEYCSSSDLQICSSDE